MAIDRFENKDILTTSKEPVENTAIYSAADIVKIPTTTCRYLRRCTNFIRQLKSHLYSNDSLVHSEQTDIEYELSGETTPYNILIKPELDVRLARSTKVVIIVFYITLLTL